MYINNLYINLVGCLIKNGKKFKAQSIVDNALDHVSLSLKTKPITILHKLGKKLGYLIELKKVKIKRNVYFVPFPVRKERRRFLFSKELLDNSATKSGAKKLNTKERLTGQMLSFLVKRGTNFNKRDSRFKQILAARSNSHFRW